MPSDTPKVFFLSSPPFSFCRLVAPLSLWLLFGTFVLGGCQPAPEIDSALTFSSNEIYRGQELAHGLAACGACHGQTPSPGSPLIGGQKKQDRYGEVTVPNLTPSSTGIQGWSAKEVVEAFRASHRPNGEPLNSEHHAGYEWMADDDAYAIAAYLLSLPPIENEIPRRSVSSFSRLTTGFSEKRIDVAGYIPEVSKKDEFARGKYLLENVARCSECHSTPASLFSSADYLEGGKTIRSEDAAEIAPNITGSEQFGIGAWTLDEIVGFLRSGRTPKGTQANPALCPTPFFARARTVELSQIATYLKTTTTTD